jgi:glucose-6-phosphate isomerase
MKPISKFSQLEKMNLISGFVDYMPKFKKSLEKMQNENIVSRIWDLDYTVWKNKPDEISNRLGWLRSADAMVEVKGEINHFVDQVRAEGFTHALLLGMGGSSLAPEVFRQTFGVKNGYLDLSVLDSTDPGAIANQEKSLDMTKTLFIVSTKSGGTVETVSLMKYFYNRATEIIGKENVGKHFIAITDPESGLASMAKSLDFRKIFLNDPDIGGRYSALSFFGIVPAALIGVEIKQILDYAINMANACKSNDPENNPGVWLGSIMGELAKIGKEKITFIISPEIKYLGAWLEQLIAESTGKQGLGILPVDGEELLDPEYYSNDRIFVQIQYGDHSEQFPKIKKLEEIDFPVLEFKIENLHEIGAEFFRWEFATIIASQIFGINPFDQPNVESAKVLARNMVSGYQEKGILPKLNYNLELNSIKILADIEAKSIQECFTKFLYSKNVVENNSGRIAYVSIQAYLTPSEKANDLLQQIRTKIQTQWKVATTIGFGPRFLHSTGQLHKGDSGNGMFIQFKAKSKNDLQIPDKAGSKDSSISFGTLISAQALGDRQALLDESRKVLLIDLGLDYENGLSEILNNI